MIRISNFVLPFPRVKSVISIIIKHICLAKTMISLPLSSHLETSMSNLRFSTRNTSTCSAIWNQRKKKLSKQFQYKIEVNNTPAFLPTIQNKERLCIATICLEQKFIFGKLSTLVETNDFHLIFTKRIAVSCSMLKYDYVHGRLVI